MQKIRNKYYFQTVLFIINDSKDKSLSGIISTINNKPKFIQMLEKIKVLELTQFRRTSTF